MLESCSEGDRVLVGRNLRQTTYGYVALLQDIRRQLDVTPEILRG
jgi:hypothetical protein